MKLSVVFILLAVFTATASINAQQMKVDLKIKSTTLNKVLWKLEEKADVVFFYSSEDKVSEIMLPDLDFKNEEVAKILSFCLKNTELQYRFEHNVVVISKKKEKVQQKSITITGKVTDKKKNPLPGVSVIVKGTNLGVATDVNGKYKIDIPDKENIVLVFSFMGMKTREILLGKDKIINVTLEEATHAVDEVIVTGYQEIKKERMTGSVSTVSAKEIAASGVTTIDQVLRGQLAGVSTMNISGRPGASSQIRIRGLNSITGDMNPIWIVDGMEMQGAVPSIEVGGNSLMNTLFTNGIGNIAPEDIKGITVLKDAAASAVYGARAANGVIVIETKRGTAGESYINVSSSYAISEAPGNQLEMMNTTEKIAYERGIYEDFSGVDIKGRVFQILKKIDNGEYSKSEGEAMISDLSKINTNWFDIIFQTAKTQRHNVSFSGGNKKLQYYVSGNYSNEEGILKRNKLSNFGANINVNYKPNNKIKLDATINTNIRKDQMPLSREDPFKYATYANTYEKPYNEDGSFAFDRSYYGERNLLGNGYKYDYNIIDDLNSGTRKNRAISTSITGKITYDVFPFLSIESQVKYTYASNNGEEWANPGSIVSQFRNVLRNSGMYGDLPDEYNNGYLKETSGYSNEFAVKNIITFNKTIESIHHVNVLLGQEISERNTRNFFNNMPEYNPDYKIAGYPGSFPEGITLTKYKWSYLGNSRRAESKHSSFFATGSYSYDDKYILSGSVRYDGSDIIGNENQFSPLWNASAKWNLHKENKISEMSFIDVLSLRFSFGYTGSIDHSALPFSTLIYKSLNYYDGTLMPTNINWKNPGIKWQKKLDRNIGLDFSFLKNRVSGEINYYSNKVNDVLDNKELPVSSGRTSIRANVASITNRGLEINLKGVLVNSNDIRWSVDVNVNKNKGVVDKTFFNNLSDLPIVKRNNAKYMTKYFVKGYPISSWFGMKFAGVDPTTGNTLAYVVDESKVKPWEVYGNKNGKKIIDLDRNFNYEACITNLGEQYPPITGGFGTDFRYKQFSVGARFSYMADFLIKSVRYTTSTDYFSTNINRLKVDQNRWRQVGDVTNIPEFRRSGLAYAYNAYFFDNELEKGDFLKMTYLNLSWYLPNRIVKKMGMQRCRLSFNAQNLFTWTKYKGIDPENNGVFRYPSPRKYTLSLNINI